MRTKTAIAGAIALVLAATAAVAWSGMNLPPPLWIAKYGIRPGCKPTGKVVRAEGLEFVIIGPGICRIGSDYLARHPQSRYSRFFGFTIEDLLGRLCRPIGISEGRAERPSFEMPVHWLVVRRDEGVECFKEEHRVRFWTRAEMAGAFESAGFGVRFVEQGRGLYVCRRA